MDNEFDAVVIGAGPGGYVAAIRLAQLGLKTACIEKRGDLGGTCLHVGCIPSKTLLHASHQYDLMRRHSHHFGVEGSCVTYSLEKMMQRKREVITTLSGGISSLFKKNKVFSFTGEASFISSHEIVVKNQKSSVVVKGKNFIIASGSEPSALPFLPFDEKKILSSEGALSIAHIPSSLLVIGAGVIGLELGSVFSRLGSQVRFVEFLSTLCPTMDGDISKGLLDVFQKEGMKFSFNTKVCGAHITEKAVALHLESKEGIKEEVIADAVLVSIGRRPYTLGLQLERASVQLSDRGEVIIDPFFRTSTPHIYAIGDVVDGPMLAHKASEEGVAVAEIIAGLNPHVDYASMPNVIYTHPEAASVGLSSAAALSAGLKSKEAHVSMKSSPRAKCNGDEVGFVKVIANKDNDKLLGVHILCAGASEMIPIASLAIKERMTATQLGDLCFAHPTMAEAIKEAALAINQKAIHK